MCSPIITKAHLLDQELLVLHNQFAYRTVLPERATKQDGRLLRSEPLSLVCLEQIEEQAYVPTFFIKPLLSFVEKACADIHAERHCKGEDWEVTKLMWSLVLNAVTAAAFSDVILTSTLPVM